MRSHFEVLAAVAAGISALTRFTAANIANGHASYVNYTTVTGYFLQDELATNATTFDFTKNDFGLIDRSYSSDSSYDPRYKRTQWQRFAHQVKELNHKAGKNTEYKILFLGRHGNGYHNQAETFYGTPAWNCYYSIRDGNATVNWADARLTPLGVDQALTAHNFWASQLQAQKQPPPQSYYTSPLTRCLQTANYTFDGLKLPRAHRFKPLVKELLREGISGHTCDRRGSVSYIRETFPTYRIEAGFSEDDPLWQALHAETSVDQKVRSKIVLDEIFQADDNTYISITSHSGEIASILGVLGHRPFSLSTGAVIPVLVKAETISAAPPQTSLQPFTGICTCTSPPAASATTSACAQPSGTGSVPKYPSRPHLS